MVTEPEYVQTEEGPDVSIQQTAVALESTNLLYHHDKNTAFNLFFDIGGTARKLPKGYVFPSKGLHSLIIYWYYRNLSKQISPFMLILWRDCENDVQKCLISKMKRMMDLVAKAGKQKGILKSNTYYLGSVKRCYVLFEHVELLFNYLEVTHIPPHEE